MRDCNFGMGVLHVKVKYLRIFCDVISLLARFFFFHQIEYPKRCLGKKKEFFLWRGF